MGPGADAPARRDGPVSAGALFLAVFLACAVEAVEATTIVLAAGTARDWRSAITGVLAGLGLRGSGSNRARSSARAFSLLNTGAVHPRVVPAQRPCCEPWFGPPSCMPAGTGVPGVTEQEVAPERSVC